MAALSAKQSMISSKRVSVAFIPTIEDEGGSGNHAVHQSPSLRAKLSSISTSRNTINVCCPCAKTSKVDPKLLEKKLQEKEDQLKEEFQKVLEKEISDLKENFEYILQNEQIRTTHMLQEAQRERKEKIEALQRQLECKNIAGLMYVMCAERNKCKMEKLNIIETFTNYIEMLNDILTDGQELILNLSRGYKTAARVNHEWQEKMKAVVGEFQAFIYNFSGTTPEQNQHFFDLPKLLKIDAPTEDNPNEDPIDEDLPESPYVEEYQEDQKWWEKLDQDCRPFAVYGDMSNLAPPQRREALKKVKATKTAPRKWTEYMFHDMFLRSGCPYANEIKQDYLDRVPEIYTWANCGKHNDHEKAPSPPPTARTDCNSVDIRGYMGSILKIITGLAEPVTKANLLGARDSMEIMSTTKVRDKCKSLENVKAETKKTEGKKANSVKMNTVVETESAETSATTTAVKHRDSLEVIPRHQPDRDHKISFERKCPVADCQKTVADTFLRSLPSYMRANPFMHYEQTFEEYEPCTPEQIEILQQRLKDKCKPREDYVIDPLVEWKESVPGIAVQTDDLSYLDERLPPCTCRDPCPTPEEGPGIVYRLQDLIPVKLKINDIAQNCLWDDSIQFKRFKVIGHDSSDSLRAKKKIEDSKQHFASARLQGIKKVLKEYPSLLDIFQASTR